MIYSLKFKNGKVYRFEADRVEDNGKRLSLFKNDGSLVAGYQDSDIASCECVAAVEVVAGEPHCNGGALLYDADGNVVSVYRTEQAART